MIAAHEKLDAIAGFDGTDVEVPIGYVKLGEPTEGAGSKGKGSRWNALRHGCMAKLLFPADLEAEIEQCTAILTEEHRPRTAYELGIVKELGRLAAQIERLEKMKVVDRQRTMDRAMVCWDSDRSVYIDKLVKGLSSDPRGVSRALKRTKQGVIWLMENWELLIDAAEKNGSWDEAQCSLAMDLLGLPLTARNGYSQITPETSIEDLDKRMTAELDRLGDLLRKSLVAFDHATRDMAATGMPMEEDAETKRLRKDDGRLRLAYRRAKAELLESRARAAAAAAAPVAAPVPTAAAPRTRTDVDAESGPRDRPRTPVAAHNFIMQQASQDSFEIPATATAPAKVVKVWLPYPGGDAPADSECPSEAPSEVTAGCDPEARCAAGPELDVAAEPTVVVSQTTRVAAGAAPAPSANERPDRERRQRRAQEKKARKVARRRRR